MIDVFQIGSRRHYAVPRIFHEHKMLRNFYTDITGASKTLSVFRYLPAMFQESRPIRRLMERNLAGVPASKVTEFPLLGLSFASANMLVKSTKNSLIVKRVALEHFGKSAVKAWDRNCDSVYGFNLGALEIFRVARMSGINTICDQMILPRQGLIRLLEEERRRWPDWEVFDYKNDSYFVAREIAEWEHSSKIICPSNFVRKGLIEEGVSEEKIKLIPFGFSPTNNVAHTRNSRKSDNGKVKVLFVGTVSLRKGIQYLYRATKRIRSHSIDIDIDVIGKPTIAKEALQNISAELNIRGLMPKSRVIEEMARADIFVFPSICEGSAMVIFEALSCGLPVVTTANAGSVVENGKEGIIVKAGDERELARAIEKLAGDDDLRLRMGQEAIKTANKYSLEQYGKRLVSVSQI